MITSLDLFKQNFRTKLVQYVYGSLEKPVDSTMEVLQIISGLGNLNWHAPENKDRMANVFTQYATKISQYDLSNGDFRSYCLNSLIFIVVDEYEQELINLVFSSTYNISPEAAIPSLSDNYSTQLPQNSNFPDKTTTATEFEPSVDDIRLLPKSLYPTQLD